MTPEQFRKIALALPETEEVGHLGHPDFRVRGKVFATLGYPDKDWGMVKLAVDEQLGLVAAMPHVFVPVKGTWGERGATNVRLKSADTTTVRKAMILACAAIAPRRTRRVTSKKKAALSLTRIRPG